MVLRVGHRITILHGKHAGKFGRIVKLNDHRHRVLVTGYGLGFVPAESCLRTHIHDDGTMSTASPSTASVSTLDESREEHLYLDAITREVIVDLLAKDITRLLPINVQSWRDKLVVRVDHHLANRIAEPEVDDMDSLLDYYVRCIRHLNFRQRQKAMHELSVRIHYFRMDLPL